MKKIAKMAALTLIGGAVGLNPAFAQKGKGKDKDKEKGKTAQETPKAEPEKKSDKKTIEETVKKCMKTDGLFTFYQDSVSGSAYILIKKEQMGKEYINFVHTVDGVVEAGQFRGAYRDSYPFLFRKYFDKIELVKLNSAFYFDPKSPISKAAQANMSNAALISEKIEAEDSLSYLIKADGMFLSEDLCRIKPNIPPAMAARMFSLGSLSATKTKYAKIRNYPKNTDVVVDYVYENKMPTNGGSEEVTDARFVSVVMQHSFIEAPENNGFTVRKDDPRLGYFTQKVNDMTTTDAVNFKDAVNRWNLVKKDPAAALSEPTEPIVWWIENTTPLEFRKTIADAVLQWNQAFEKIGFKNAMQVNIQPDDATWEAGDIRYNVLRWTASPNPPFGGYGPSLAHPRTGQILGADIMLEFTHFTNRVRYKKLLNEAAFEQDKHDAAWVLGQNKHYCSFAEELHEGLLLGYAAIKAFGGGDMEMKGLREQGMYELLMHEVGHTLGLNHNMKASQLYAPEQLHDKNLTAKTGLTGSVMDYVAVNINRDKTKQGHYYSMNLGPYDYWAIDYAYSPALADPEQENARLQKIASRSAEKELAFGNDADDMRYPGFAVDPRVMIGDLSNDAVAYAVDRIQFANELLPKLKERYNEAGNSYHELRQMHGSLGNQIKTMTGIMSRYVGGIYVDRAFTGQAGATKPFTAIPLETQKKAMEGLKKHLFAPDAFDAFKSLADHLQMQRRGYDFFFNNEDPKIHEWALDMQKNTLAHLLHPNVLARIVDSETYGNQYKIADVMGDLNKAIFEADAAGNVNTFRQNLQEEYTQRLLDIYTGKSPEKFNSQARAMALYNLQAIQTIARGSAGDMLTKAHRANLSKMIQRALDK